MISAKNLTYQYEENNKTINVLNGVDFDIKDGEFLCIIGHNGSGKSTLAKLFNAIYLPSGGVVYVDEFNTSDEAVLYEIRQRVGMVFQNPDNQIVATIVEEDVAFGPENLGVETSEIRKRVDDALKTVNMYAYKDHAPHMLSGGQKQKIAIAGILAMQPKVMIFDESTAMLDPLGRKEVLETIIKLNKEKNITVILITHYMEETINADRIIVLDKGKIAACGTPKEIFSTDDISEKYNLDLPVAAKLSMALRKSGVDTDICLSVDEMNKELERVLKK